MQVSAKALYNTKMWVPRADAMAVQSALLKQPEFGYELALNKSKIKRKFDRKARIIAFFIDHAGMIEYIQAHTEDLEDCYDEYRDANEDEINYEVTLSNY